MTSLPLEAAINATTDDRLDRGFDAIVVGAGASGGLAAKSLTQAGLAVLVLDAGWKVPFWLNPYRRTSSNMVRAIANPKLQPLLPPKLTAIGRRALRLMGKVNQPIQTRCFAWEMAPESFVDDRQNPYIQEVGSHFHWFRAHQLGGRMTIPGHGRQYYRLADRDFHSGDGLSPNWPLSQGELDPWYSSVEKDLGMTGGQEHCDWVPDSEITHLKTPSPAEENTIQMLKTHFSNVTPMLGRFAPPLDNMAAAAESGRLFCRRGAVAGQVEVGADGHVKGVVWHDRVRGRQRTSYAPRIFLCASALESTRILLASYSTQTGRGLATRSDSLGRYLMDHVLVNCDGIGGQLPGPPVPPAEPGRCIYLPRFDLRNGVDGVLTDRGYGVQIYRWTMAGDTSHFSAVSFAEMTPRAENRITLDPVRKDAWGFPVARINCRHNDSELRMAKNQSSALCEIARVLGVKVNQPDDRPAIPGTAIHECGTARMGTSQDNSVVDPHNEVWDAKGLYVTDGACFPSQGAQNPTLTILALTARACFHSIGKG